MHPLKMTWDFQSLVKTTLKPKSHEWCCVIHSYDKSTTTLYWTIVQVFEPLYRFSSFKILLRLHCNLFDRMSTPYCGLFNSARIVFPFSLWSNRSRLYIIPTRLYDWPIYEIIFLNKYKWLPQTRFSFKKNDHLLIKINYVTHGRKKNRQEGWS